MLCYSIWKSHVSFVPRNADSLLEFCLSISTLLGVMLYCLILRSHVVFVQVYSHSWGKASNRSKLQVWNNATASSQGFGGSRFCRTIIGWSRRRQDNSWIGNAIEGRRSFEKLERRCLSSSRDEPRCGTNLSSFQGPTLATLDHRTPVVIDVIWYWRVRGKRKVERGGNLCNQKLRSAKRYP